MEENSNTPLNSLLDKVKNNSQNGGVDNGEISSDLISKNTTVLNELTESISGHNGLNFNLNQLTDEIIKLNFSLKKNAPVNSSNSTKQDTKHDKKQKKWKDEYTGGDRTVPHYRPTLVDKVKDFSPLAWAAKGTMFEDPLERIREKSKFKKAGGTSEGYENQQRAAREFHKIHEHERQLRGMGLKTKEIDNYQETDVIGESHERLGYRKKQARELLGSSFTGIAKEKLDNASKIVSEESSDRITPENIFNDLKGESQKASPLGSGEFTLTEEESENYTVQRNILKTLEEIRDSCGGGFASKIGGKGEKEEGIGFSDIATGVDFIDDALDVAKHLKTLRVAGTLASLVSGLGILAGGVLAVGTFLATWKIGDELNKLSEKWLDGNYKPDTAVRRTEQMKTINSLESSNPDLHGKIQGEIKNTLQSKRDVREEENKNRHTRDGVTDSDYKPLPQHDNPQEEVDDTINSVYKKYQKEIEKRKIGGPIETNKKYISGEAGQELFISNDGKYSREIGTYGSELLESNTTGFVYPITGMSEDGTLSRKFLDTDESTPQSFIYPEESSETPTEIDKEKSITVKNDSASLATVDSGTGGGFSRTARGVGSGLEESVQGIVGGVRNDSENSGVHEKINNSIPNPNGSKPPVNNKDLNLATITTKSGKKAQVDAKYAENFQNFINELEETGYEINDLGGFADRNAIGSDKKSVHASGASIDINPSKNPYAKGKDAKLVTDMPENVSEIARKHGIGWGGDWTSAKDAMHFSMAKHEGGSVEIDRSLGTANIGRKPQTEIAQQAVPTGTPIPQNQQTSNAPTRTSVNQQGNISSSSEIPENMKSMRIKTSNGKTKTIGELGITTYDELQQKGGQAFQGGKNDPATLIATNMIAQDLGDNFDRVTAQNDAYHARNAPESGHTQGVKTDFTVKNMSYKEAHKRASETMARKGLVEGKDFKIISSPHGTGNHIDFKLMPSGKAKISQTQVAEAQADPMAPGWEEQLAADTAGKGTASAAGGIDDSNTLTSRMMNTPAKAEPITSSEWKLPEGGDKTVADVMNKPDNIRDGGPDQRRKNQLVDDAAEELKNTPAKAEPVKSSGGGEIPKVNTAKEYWDSEAGKKTIKAVEGAGGKDPSKPVGEKAEPVKAEDWKLPEGGDKTVAEAMMKPDNIRDGGPDQRRKNQLADDADEELKKVEPKKDKPVKKKTSRKKPVKKKPPVSQSLSSRLDADENQAMNAAMQEAMNGPAGKAVPFSSGSSKSDSSSSYESYAMELSNQGGSNGSPNVVGQVAGQLNNAVQSAVDGVGNLLGNLLPSSSNQSLSSRLDADENQAMNAAMQQAMDGPAGKAVPFSSSDSSISSKLDANENQAMDAAMQEAMNGPAGKAVPFSADSARPLPSQPNSGKQLYNQSSDVAQKNFQQSKSQPQVTVNNQGNGRRTDRGVNNGGHNTGGGGNKTATGGNSPWQNQAMIRYGLGNFAT